jgi:hypothetical protein
VAHASTFSFLAYSRAPLVRAAHLIAIIVSHANWPLAAPPEPRISFLRSHSSLVSVQVLPSSSTSHKDQVTNVERDEESIHQPINDSSSTSTQDASSQLKIHNAIAKDHLIDQIIGDINKGVQTRSHLASFCEHYSFISCGEPTRIEESLDDPDWLNAMHEELNNFACNEV